MPGILHKWHFRILDLQCKRGYTAIFTYTITTNYEKDNNM